jgi:hypothetical protein
MIDVTGLAWDYRIYGQIFLQDGLLIFIELLTKFHITNKYYEFSEQLPVEASIQT